MVHCPQSSYIFYRSIFCNERGWRVKPSFEVLHAVMDVCTVLSCSALWQMNSHRKSPSSGQLWFLVLRRLTPFNGLTCFCMWFSAESCSVSCLYKGPCVFIRDYRSFNHFCLKYHDIFLFTWCQSTLNVTFKQAAAHAVDLLRRCVWIVSNSSSVVHWVLGDAVLWYDHRVLYRVMLLPID